MLRIARNLELEALFLRAPVSFSFHYGLRSAWDRHEWGPSSYLCPAYTHRLDTVLLFTEVFVSCKSLLFIINLNRGHGPLSPIYKYFVHVRLSCIYLPHLQLLFQFKHSSCIKVQYLYYAFVNDPSWPRRPPIHLRSLWQWLQGIWNNLPWRCGLPWILGGCWWGREMWSPLSARRGIHMLLRLPRWRIVGPTRFLSTVRSPIMRLALAGHWSLCSQLLDWFYL